MVGFQFVANIAPNLDGPPAGARRNFVRPEEIPSADWTILVPGPRIAPDVRVWYVPHRPGKDGTPEVAVTPEDVNEFAPIRDAATRRRSLLTRAALRIALSEMAGGVMAPRDWRFGRTAMGKPVIENGPGNLHFSCSHAKAASIIAVSLGRPIGIDIEASLIPLTAQWMKDTFTTFEQETVNALPPSERQTAISRLWTLKEAYLKMLGTGIADVLSVAFDPRSDCLVSGQPARRETMTFQTWIANCQGQPLTVAIAIGDGGKGTSWRRTIEESLVRLRARFASRGERADQGTAAAPSLF